MSGHSHWATIKRKKQANDQLRGKEFSRASAEIMLAISLGNNVTDPDKNIRLRAAIERAKEVNMPKDNIKRLIDRLEQRAEKVVEVAYEALGPGNSHFIITTATDNPRRTQTDLKIALDKNGGKLVEKGAVMHGFYFLTMFTIKGFSEDKVLNLIEALSAVDFSKEGDTYYVYTQREQFNEAWQKARELGFSKAPELVYKPKAVIKVSPPELLKIENLLSKIEDIEEVQAVYANVEI